LLFWSTVSEEKRFGAWLGHARSNSFALERDLFQTGSECFASVMSGAAIDGVILGKTWSVHRVSPLFKFELGKVTKYAQRLTQLLRASFEGVLTEEEKSRREMLGQRADVDLELRQLSDHTGLYLRILVTLFVEVRKRKRENIDDRPNPDEMPELKSQKSVVVLCCTSKETNLLDPPFLGDDSDEDSEDSEDDDPPQYENRLFMTSRKRKRKSMNPKKDRRFTKFKFALCKGKNPVIDKVLRWIESRFDCVFSERPISVAPYNLAELASSFVTKSFDGEFGDVTLPGLEFEDDGDDDDDGGDSDPDKKRAATKRRRIQEKEVKQSKAAQALEMSFEMPDSVKDAGLSSLHVSVPGKGLKKLFESMKRDNLSSISSSSSTLDSSQYPGDTHDKAELLRRMGEGLASSSSASRDAEGQEEQRFIPAASTSTIARENALVSRMNQFIAEHLCIRLNGTSLTRIATPLMVLSAEGRVKVLHMEALGEILRQLSILCQIETGK